MASELPLVHRPPTVQIAAAFFTRHAHSGEKTQEFAPPWVHRKISRMPAQVPRHTQEHRIPVPSGEGRADLRTIQIEEMHFDLPVDNPSDQVVRVKVSVDQARAERQCDDATRFPDRRVSPEGLLGQEDR